MTSAINTLAASASVSNSKLSAEEKARILQEESEKLEQLKVGQGEAQ